MTGVRTEKLSLKLAFGVFAALATSACQSSDRASDVGAAVSPDAPQVKPAVAPAKEPEPEPALAAAEPEAAEMPRGVSAPQPEPRDQTAPTAVAAAKASDTAPKPTKPSASLVETSAKPKAVDAPAPAVVKKAPVPAKSKPVEPPPVIAQPVAPPPEPAPPPPPPPPPAPKKTSVIVPQTDHVRVEVPSGLQHWLDEDDRMRPWLGKAINVADSCYAKVRGDNPSASGEIAFVVTMHENARPSGKVSSVSSPISGIVMCATTRLLGVKMPLFTGKEGESYTVRVRFSP